MNIDLDAIERAHVNWVTAATPLYRNNLRMVLESILLPQVPALIAEVRRLRKSERLVMNPSRDGHEDHEDDMQ